MCGVEWKAVYERAHGVELRTSWFRFGPGHYIMWYSTTDVTPGVLVVVAFWRCERTLARSPLSSDNRSMVRPNACLTLFPSPTSLYRHTEDVGTQDMTMRAAK